MCQPLPAPYIIVISNDYSTKDLSAHNLQQPSLTNVIEMHQSPLTILTTNRITLPTTNHNADQSITAFT